MMDDMNRLESVPQSERGPEAAAVLERHGKWLGNEMALLRKDAWLGRFVPEDAENLDWFDADLMRELSGLIDEWLEKELKKRN